MKNCNQPLISDSRHEQHSNDIVKSSRTVQSSPERSLLAETPMHHHGGDHPGGSLSIDLETSPTTSSSFREPPRNIFDDI